MNVSAIGNTTIVLGEGLSGLLTIDRLGIISGILVGVIALFMSRYGILPDIEFQYELRNLSPDHIVKEYQRYFYEHHKETYRDIYSHLILFNGGNGKASNINIAYNWNVDGKIGGFNTEVLKTTGVALIGKNYLFPGQEDVGVPAIDFGSDVFEEADRLLIRVQYTDCIGGGHCKCAIFVGEEDRSFAKINKTMTHCIRTVRIFRKVCHRCKFRGGVCSDDALIQVSSDDLEKYGGKSNEL